MKTKLTLSGLLLIAGILFLVASPQYAKATDAADHGSMLGGVLSLPAILFCAAGLVGVLAPMVVLVTELHRACSPNNLNEPTR